jgi:hypothetical protein
MEGRGLVCFGSKQGQVVACFEQGNEFTASINGEEYLE